MHQAIGEPRLTLRAAPQVAEALNDRIAEIAHEEGFDGRVQISADPALANADCRIEWRGGGAERAEAALEAAIDTLIARHFSNAAPVQFDGGLDHGGQRRSRSAGSGHDDAAPEANALLKGDDAADTDAKRSSQDLEAVFDVPVTVSAVLGKSGMEVSELLSWARARSWNWTARSAKPSTSM